jgi:hypothetical protein
MNSRTATMMLTVMAVVAIGMILATGPLVADHHAFAYKKHYHKHHSNHKHHYKHHYKHSQD